MPALEEKLRRQRKLTATAMVIAAAGLTVGFVAFNVSPPPPPKPEPPLEMEIPEPGKPAPKPPDNRVKIDPQRPITDIDFQIDPFQNDIVDCGGCGDQRPFNPSPEPLPVLVPDVPISERPDVLPPVIGQDWLDYSGKTNTTGKGTRISGATTLTFLQLPSLSGTSDGPGAWASGELENIADFISRRTAVHIRLGSRAVSFVGLYSSFDHWLAACKQRAISSGAVSISAIDPDIDALRSLEAALPYLADKQYELFYRRLNRTVAEYFRVKHNARIDLTRPNWVKQAFADTARPAWHIQSVRAAEKAFRAAHDHTAPTGEELRGLYDLLRVAEIMELPVLLCDVAGVPATLAPENLRYLRTYVNNGGFLYFTNTTGYQTCMGVRGLIRDITQEQLADPEGEKTLARLRTYDRQLSGYEFRQPEPAIFSAWTFFPIVIPRRTDVKVTIFNRNGARVSSRTLRNLAPGTYLQKYKHYRWFGLDNEYNEVESGYYIAQIEAGLCRQTWPIYLSKLRKLAPGKHPVYAAYFPVDEVPTSEPVRPEALPYGDMGVYGWTAPNGALAICYTEGYKEKEWLRNLGTRDSQQESALRWVTNVVLYGVAEGSIVR